MGTIREPARAAAIKAGHRTYFTGVPCKNGHIAPRLVSCHDCTECSRIKCRDRYRKDPDKWREKHRQWVSQNREVWLKLCRDAARRRRAEISAAKPFLPQIVREQRGLCAGCRQQMDKPTIDHILAISRGGGSEQANLQALCGPCNKSKGAKDQKVWKEELWHRSGPIQL